MKKLKKLAAGVVFAGTAFCVAPVIAFSPVAESVVFAMDGAISVEEGDSFEIRETLNVVAGNIRLADESADFQVLSQETNEGETEGTYVFYALCLINTPGEHEVIIEDDNNNILKTVSVNVTEMPKEDPPEEEGNESGQQEGTGEDDSVDDNSNETVSDEGEDGQENADGDAQGASSEDEAVDPVRFVPAEGGKISGTTESGVFKEGEIITLKAEPDKGWVFRKWVIRTMDGRIITAEMDISEDGTFTLPGYPIRISAEFEYYLIDEIELLDVTTELEVGKPVKFTGHVKDNTDPRFFLLAEIWINEYDTKGITSNKATNEKLQKDEGLDLLEEVVSGDKYNYSVMFMTTEGYEFADDVKLIYNGKEYKPTKDLQEGGQEMVAFNGFLSFGEQTNPRETKTTTKTVIRQETRTETVTQYVYNTYTYTTYQYVTKTVTTPVTYRTVAASTGDTNNTAVWIALAVAAGGGVVSGILVGRRRKRNK